MVVAATLALTLFAAPTEASPAVGVLPVRIEAELAAPDRQAVAEHFSEGLSRSGFAVQPVRSEGAETCDEPACYQQIATETGTTQLVGASIVQAGPDYQVSAFVVDGATGETFVTADGVCEICGMQELDEMVEGLAARLRSKLGNVVRPTGLRVTSDPSGAHVYVDGIDAGTTPIDVPVEPGPHEVELHHEGYRSITATEEVGAEGTAEVNYTLKKKADIPAWLPWTAIGVGSGALVSGIVLMAIDGNEIKRNCNADIDGRCEFVHKTLPGGVVLTVGGVAAIGTGVALAIIRRRNGKPEPRVEANAWLHMPGLSISGRF